MMVLPPLWVLTQKLSDGRYYFANSERTIVGYKTRRAAVRLADEWSEGWDVEKFVPISEIPKEVLEGLDHPECLFVILKHNGQLHHWPKGRELMMFSRSFEAFRESMSVEGGLVIGYISPKGL